MRKIVVIAAFSLIIALAGIAVGQRAASAQGGSPVLLQDAVSKKMVTLVLSGTGDIFFRQAAGYQITNTTPGDLIVVIPVGLLLPSDDTSLQTLVVGQAVTITLKSRQTAGGQIWVFCTQLSNHAPSSGDVYHVGSMATGNLLNVVQVIAKHGWNGDIGAQLAVWRITDNATEEQITGSSNSNASELLRAIGPLLGLAGDPFTRAEQILQEAGTGLHYSEFGTPVPAQSPLPGNTNLPDILGFLQRCAGCCPCLGAFGGLFFLLFVRR